MMKMSEEEKKAIEKLDYELTYSWVHNQGISKETLKLFKDIIEKQQKEIEDLRNPVICGRNIDEIVNILMALDIEKQYKIEVTMENLISLMKIYQAEVEKSIRDAQIKIIDDLTGSGCKIEYSLPHYNFDEENKDE